MGDVWKIDIPQLVETIRGHLMPGTILITTAPPCKDHSKIRDSPPGLTGQDGSLLQHMVDIEWAIRLLIPEHPIETLMENVLPHDAIQEHFDDITDQWGAHPIVLDSADGHMVSRPRLWWNTIQWERAQETISTQTPWQLTWEKHPPYDRLHNPIAADLQPNIRVKGWEIPNVLAQGGLFHCLTTQANTDEGRPPPQHTDVDQATWEQLHTTHTGSTFQRQAEEHHARQRMAFANSHMVTLSIIDPSNGTHPTVTKHISIRPNDTSLAEQPITLWPSTQNAHQREHAPVRLAIPSTMGSNTSSFLLQPKTDWPNAHVGHTDRTEATHAVHSTFSNTRNPTTD